MEKVAQKLPSRICLRSSSRDTAMKVPYSGD